MINKNGLSGKMIEKINLLPCPFCGGKAKRVAEGGDHWIFCIKCKTTSNCGKEA